MSESGNDEERRLAIRIAEAATDDERDALRAWIERLLELKRENLPVAEKAKRAVAMTADSRLVLPAVKLVAAEAKRLAWDEREQKERVAIGGTAVGLAVFGWQFVGIAALGAAVGVPLWVVFGSGAGFLGVLEREIDSRRKDE